MKAIKNYRSTIAINKILEQIQQVLVKHGARQITFDYGPDVGTSRICAKM